MKNITMYADGELSLIFLNEEYYYKQLVRHANTESWNAIIEICDESFIYTDEQLQDLKETFDNEVSEAQL